MTIIALSPSAHACRGAVVPFSGCHMTGNAKWVLAALMGIALGCSARQLGDQRPTVRAAVEVAAADEPAPKKADPIVQAASALYEGVRFETLDNGLRVYLKPIAGSPVVTTMVAYKVGSADEELDSTGLSHYLEHLMFKGTDKLMPGDIDKLTLRNGGANNAYTSDDYTVFHFDFAADRWPIALDIEADRMRNLRIDAKHEFQEEKGAVIEELQRDEDEPWDLESKQILPLLFGEKHPYGHPVIGEKKHVEAATAEIIKGHYDRWYHPNNAALVICGGFDADDALARVKKLFGPIPNKTLPGRKPIPEYKRKGPVQHEFESRFAVPRMLMGFNTVRSNHVDHFPLEVLQGVLSGGKTARLYKKLVEQERIAGEASSSNSTGRYPGWFSVQVEVLAGKDRKKAQALVLAELEKLRDEPVSDAELKRVKRGLLASAIFQRESAHNLADNIARGVTTNDLDYLKTYLSRLDAVTAKDVQEAARKYFDPEQRVVVWSVPGKVGGQSRRHGDGIDNSLVAASPHRSVYRTHPQKAAAGTNTGFSLKDAQRVVLDNGLILLLFENHRLPIIAADAHVRNVRLFEPPEQSGLTNLMGRMLDEGTEKHTSQEIAELIENVGGSLDMSSSGGSVRVLSPDRSLGLGLLFECLTQANFPKDAFAREHEIQLSDIEDAEQQPDSRAQSEYRAMVYGKHPYALPALGKRATAKSLTREDCLAFYRKLFVPNNTVIALVGDFDSKQVIAEVKRLSADWKQNPLAKPNPPKPEKPAEFTQKFLSMPDAKQLHFFMGQPGITRDNPDYYKLLIMDYILGTGPGFTDRLSARLRDREGLAYTVSANIASSAGEEPGVFTCYIGTNPDNLARVKKSFLEELHRIRDEKPTDEEVEDVKKYLLGNLPFSLTTNDRIASQLMYVERYKLGFGYLDDYRKAVSAVTADDVQAVARKYIDPQRLVLVAAGAIDAQGRALKPAK